MATQPKTEPSVPHWTDPTQFQHSKAVRLFDAERILRVAHQVQGDRIFINEEEAATFFAQFKGRSIQDICKDTALGPLDEAQELAFQALESEKKPEALALAREALQLDSECTDAQVVLALEESGSPKLLVSALKTIVDRAEAKVGTPFLREHRGHLWEIVKARPYLRARLALAEGLERAGKPGQAIPHLEAMLKLDPADGIEARYRLVRCYLAAEQLKPLAAFLVILEKSDTTFAAWAAVLEHVHAKAGKAAESALARARKVNAFLEEFLTGRRKMPRKLPETSTPGSLEEAIIALHRFGDTWKNDRQGMYWLFKQG